MKSYFTAHEESNGHTLGHVVNADDNILRFYVKDEANESYSYYETYEDARAAYENIANCYEITTVLNGREFKSIVTYSELCNRHAILPVESWIEDGDDIDIVVKSRNRSLTIKKV